MIKPSLPSHCKPKKHWEHAEESHTSMVGSYSSTKWFWMSWMVSALLPTPPAPTTTSLYSVILAAAAHRTHTHTHAAAGEERGDRKRQVSILTDTHTHTAGLEMMQSTSGDTDKAYWYYHYCPVVRKRTWFVCASVCSGGWGWDPQRGMWKMCWRYSMFQSSPTQCEQQRVSMRGRVREAVREKKESHDTGRLTLITQDSFTDVYVWTESDGRRGQKDQIRK